MISSGTMVIVPVLAIHQGLTEPCVASLQVLTIHTAHQPQLFSPGYDGILFIGELEESP